jgi:hypothetical protein
MLLSEEHCFYIVEISGLDLTKQMKAIMKAEYKK